MAVSRGDITQSVQATGNVAPLNAVAILPPLAGRVDKIVVYEGASVKKGQVLAWMSSADRAALLDMARSQGPDVVKYWESTYMASPIVSPSNGIIVARNVVEGQTIGTTTDAYDLSDHLVVLGDVDETDLAQIRMGQIADCTVDAYPSSPFKARVTLIGHQAIKVNNVISYQITLEPLKEPGELRSGMTADINFIVQEKKQVLWLPAFAVKGQSQGPARVRLIGADGKPTPQMIQLGISDGARVEVVSGLNDGDSVFVSSLNLPTAAAGGPLSPGGSPNGQGRGQGGGGGQGH